MPNDMLPDLAIVLTFLRQGQGWSQTRLCKAAKMKTPLLNDLEHGRKPLTRARLEHIISFMGLPPEVIDATWSSSRRTTRQPRRLPTGPAGGAKPWWPRWEGWPRISREPR